MDKIEFDIKLKKPITITESTDDVEEKKEFDDYMKECDYTTTKTLRVEIFDEPFDEDTDVIIRPLTSDNKPMQDPDMFAHIEQSMPKRVFISILTKIIKTKVMEL